jgi:hypothetical protein
MILKCLESVSKEIPVYSKDKQEVIDIKVKWVKRDFVTKMDVDPEQITTHKQFFNDKGEIYKNRCIVNITGFGNVIVKHSFEEITEIKSKLTNNIKVHGFRGK